MTASRLQKILSILHKNLSEQRLRHALIGAMALSLYGIPRYTADIDLLAEQKNRNTIKTLMSTLGFECFQDTEAFAQFDSEMGVYGKVDFMFVHTPEGAEILESAVIVEDEYLGPMPVIQPTDYAVLKLMAIANQPDRKYQDIADLQVLLKAEAAGFIPSVFHPVDTTRLLRFAKRFGVAEELTSLLPFARGEK